MKSSFKAFFIIVFVVIVQTSLLPQYLMPAFKPDLLLIVMVYLALRAPLETSLPSAYALGILKDCTGGIYLGLNGFSFLAVYIFLKSVSDRLYVRSGLLFVITVSLATAAVVALDMLLLALFSQAQGLSASVLNAVIPHILVNAFFASIFAILPAFSASWHSR